MIAHKHRKTMLNQIEKQAESILKGVTGSAWSNSAVTNGVAAVTFGSSAFATTSASVTFSSKNASTSSSAALASKRRQERANQQLVDEKSAWKDEISDLIEQRITQHNPLAKLSICNISIDNLSSRDLRPFFSKDSYQNSAHVEKRRNFLVDPTPLRLKQIQKNHRMSRNADISPIRSQVHNTLEVDDVATHNLIPNNMNGRINDEYNASLIELNNKLIDNVDCVVFAIPPQLPFNSNLLSMLFQRISALPSSLPGQELEFAIEQLLLEIEELEKDETRQLEKSRNEKIKEKLVAEKEAAETQIQEAKKRIQQQKQLEDSTALKAKAQNDFQANNNVKTGLIVGPDGKLINQVESLSDGGVASVAGGRNNLIDWYLGPSQQKKMNIHDYDLDNSDYIQGAFKSMRTSELVSKKATASSEWEITKKRMLINVKKQGIIRCLDINTGSDPSSSSSVFGFSTSNGSSASSRLSNHANYHELFARDLAEVKTKLDDKQPLVVALSKYDKSNYANQHTEVSGSHVVYHCQAVCKLLFSATPIRRKIRQVLSHEISYFALPTLVPWIDLPEDQANTTGNSSSVNLSELALEQNSERNDNGHNIHADNLASKTVHDDHNMSHAHNHEQDGNQQNEPDEVSDDDEFDPDDPWGLKKGWLSHSAASAASSNRNDANCHDINKNASKQADETIKDNNNKHEARQLREVEKNRYIAQLQEHKLRQDLEAKQFLEMMEEEKQIGLLNEFSMTSIYELSSSCGNNGFCPVSCVTVPGLVSLYCMYRYLHAASPTDDLLSFESLQRQINSSSLTQYMRSQLPGPTADVANVTNDGSNGHVPSSKSLPTNSTSTPCFVVFHGKNLNRDLLRRGLSLCLRPVCQLKTKQDFSTQELNEIRKLHLKCPLPSGYFDGSMYVTSDGSKSYYRPDMDLICQILLKSYNQDVEKWNALAKEERKMFDQFVL
jgi:hypothetical protein